MQHQIHFIKAIEIVAPFTLKLIFGNDKCKTINFLPVLKGEVYGLLQNPAYFNKVEIDKEVKTIVWPNGADFDPAFLYVWDEHVEELTKRANEWAIV